MLNHPVSWHRRRPIEPLPVPFPWRRSVFSVLFTLAVLGVVCGVLAL